MSSDHREETHTTKDFTEHTNVVQEDNSVGSKVGQGVSYVVVTGIHDFVYSINVTCSGAMKVIHGMSPGQSVYRVFL